MVHVAYIVSTFAIAGIYSLCELALRYVTEGQGFHPVLAILLAVALACAACITVFLAINDDKEDKSFDITNSIK